MILRAAYDELKFYCKPAQAARDTLRPDRRTDTVSAPARRQLAIRRLPA